MQAGVHYPVPLHLQPAYAHLGYCAGELPVTEEVADTCLSLPLYPEMTLAQQDYVAAAKMLGMSKTRIIFRHILPNSLTPVLVTASFGVAGAILTESGLSFLGLGDPNVPSWGALLNEGRTNARWHLIVPPSVAIFITVTALNLVGDGLRDALDPKLRK